MDKKEFFKHILGNKAKSKSQEYLESCEKQQELIKEFGQELGRVKHLEWLKSQNSNNGNTNRPSAN